MYYQPSCGVRCQKAILNTSQTSLAFVLEFVPQPLLPGKQIDDHSQIQPIFVSSNVFYIANISLIRGFNIKLPTHAVIHEINHIGVANFQKKQLCRDL